MGYLYFFFVGVLYVIWILIFMGYMCYKYLLLVCDVSIFMSFKHFFHFNVIEIINFFFPLWFELFTSFHPKKKFPSFSSKNCFWLWVLIWNSFLVYDVSKDLIVYYRKSQHHGYNSLSFLWDLECQIYINQVFIDGWICFWACILSLIV